MSEIRPIETWYNGMRFRSRLEARWAVFFDALGVKYEYEPEGFELGDGTRYLPDFKVKCWGTRSHISDEPFDLYIEVKGFMSKNDAERINRFAGYGNEKVLVVNKIPAAGTAFSDWELGSYDDMDGTDIAPFNYYLIDGDWYGAYPTADKNGRFYLSASDYWYSYSDEDEMRTELAYTQARIARFEWDDTPDPKEVRQFVEGMLKEHQQRILKEKR